MVCSKQSSEGRQIVDFPRRNWALVILLQPLIAVSYFTVIPTIHQFVTNPRENYTESQLCLEEDTCGSITPGLGQSESFYSVTNAVYSVGEILASLLGGLLPRLILYRFTVLANVTTLLVGALVYGFVTKAFMLPIARFVLGMSDGLGLVIISSYIGETTTKIQNERALLDAKTNICDAKCRSSSIAKIQAQNTLKDKLFTIYLFVRGLGFPVALGISSIMVQFESIDQFRWPGWFSAGCAVVYMCVFMLFFVEQVPSCSKLSPLHSSRKEHKNCKTKRGTEKWRLPDLKRFFMYCFLAMCAYVAGQLYVILDFLLNPFLANHFGLGVEHRSYFILGVSLIFCTSSLLLLLLKMFKLDNRIVVILALLLAAIGTIIASDWQSIAAETPCDAFDHSTNHTLQIAMDYESSGSGNSSLTLFLETNCLHASTASHVCYWNQRSIVTNKVCRECLPICRSVKSSLNFAQFCIGIAILALLAPLYNTVIVIVASDITAAKSQPAVASLMITAVSVGRTVTPLWSNWIYIHSGWHTFAPMSIFCGTFLIAMFGCTLLYKHLAPRHQGVHSDISKSNSTAIDLNVSLNEDERQETAFTAVHIAVPSFEILTYTTEPLRRLFHRPAHKCEDCIVMREHSRKYSLTTSV